MRRTLLLLATMALAMLLSGGMAQAIIKPAIINGEPDRGSKAHPYAGALVQKIQGQLLNFCSGTLISPKVFLTAGHCTEPPKGKGVPKDLPTYVTFDPTFEPGSSKIIKGTPYTHPKECIPIPPINDPNCAPPPGLPGFPPDIPRYDVGVVVLNKPVRMATYGALPDAGLVDTLEKGQRLTTVGYGLRTFDPLGGERYSARVKLLNANDPIGAMFLRTTGFRGIGRGGEGFCSGDSGGPLFLPNRVTIVGVTSFSSTNRITGLCTQPLYYQRVDLPQVLKWVRSF
jgi:Trypsin